MRLLTLVSLFTRGYSMKLSQMVQILLPATTSASFRQNNFQALITYVGVPGKITL